MARKGAVARQAAPQPPERRGPDGRTRLAPGPRVEHCDGCQLMTNSSAIVNVRSDDGVFRALCPACRAGGPA